MLAGRQGFQPPAPAENSQPPSVGAEGKIGVLFNNINLTEDLLPRGRSLEPQSSTDLDMLESKIFHSTVRVEC